MIENLSKDGKNFKRGIYQHYKGDMAFGLAPLRCLLKLLRPRISLGLASFI